MLLAACGPPVQRTSVEEDTAAKAFAGPAASMAAVYIYRGGNYAPHLPVDVRVIGFVQTRLPVNTFVRAELPAGPNEVDCLINARPDRRRVELLADRIRYFEVTIDHGEWGPFCLVTEVPSSVGRAHVRSAQRIPPLYP
jgi:hypothetical protein